MVYLQEGNSTLISKAEKQMRSRLLICVFILITFLTKGQDSTRLIVRDSVGSNVVSVTPYYSHHLSTTTSYVKKIDSKDQLRFSSGVSIFNVLRGQVPGLTIPGYFDQVNTTGIRTGPFPYSNNTLVIIDGVPFDNSIGSYLNLNSFDFSSISAFSNTNTLNFLGGVNNGAFVLNSKTGEGNGEPVFEFNAYATNGWGNITNLQTGISTRKDEWHLANAISFSQDFGSIDTRVSYTLQKKFFQSYAEPYVHNLKVNTGLRVNNKLDFRLIVDGRYSKYSDTFTVGGATTTSSEDSNADLFLNGNLVARYKLNDWLTATSQLVFSRYDSSMERLGTNWRLKSQTESSRGQFNIFVNAAKNLGEKLNISGFAGAQYSAINVDESRSAYGPQYGPGQLESETNWTDKSPDFMMQANMNYARLLHFSTHYKHGSHSNSSNGNVLADAYSISSAFVFSELVGTPFLSFGKIRASIGEHTALPFSAYPVINTDYYSLPFEVRSVYRVKNFESGFDFGFLASRLTVTLNYFKNFERYDLQNNSSMAPDQYFNTGLELDSRYKVIDDPALLFESGLVISNSKIRFDRNNSVGDYSKPFLKAGWFNKLNYNSIVATMLVEAVDNYTWYASNMGFVSSSFVKLRDISIGFKLPTQSAYSTTVSLSGRNLIRFGGSGSDPEEVSSLSIFQKSVSFNINVIF